MPPTDPIHGLSTDEKRQLLRKLLRSKIDPTSEPFALTMGQRALWFLQRFVPESYAYNIPISVQFSPALDLACLQSALDAVVTRHPALRMRFEMDGGTPRQHAIPPAPVMLDMREAPSSDDTLRREVIAESRRPFDLMGPLLRITLWRASDSDVLLMTIHHLVFDGLSSVILLNDLKGFYQAAQTGVAYTPAPLTATYRDFVVAEEQLLAHNGATEEIANRGARLWSYWEQQLNGPWEDLSLPSFRPRQSRMTLRGESLQLDLTQTQVERLKALAQSQRTTFYAVIYTVMQTLVYQFTGQTDIVIGTPASTRTHSEWNGVLGYFVNMLPIRAPIDVNQSFGAQLRLVHSQVLGALAHEEFPFPAMVERLKVVRDPARTPIFQVLVNVIASSPHISSPGAETQESLFGDSRVKSYPIPMLEGQFDLAFEILETEQGWKGRWKYNTDALEAETAARMLDAFCTMIDLVAEHSELSIQQLVARAAQLNAGAVVVDLFEDPDREELSF